MIEPVIQGAAGGLVVLAIQKYGHHIKAGWSSLQASLKSWLGSRRYKRSQFRSLAGWNEDTRAEIWLNTFMKEQVPKTLAACDRQRANAHGIPYWKLAICAQLGWPVSQFDSLPPMERCAWEEYFRQDDSSRLEAIKTSWRLRDEEEVALYREYLKQREDHQEDPLTRVTH